MSTSAIVMMLIGCIGLWGGCAVAVGVAMKHNKKDDTAVQADMESDSQKES